MFNPFRKQLPPPESGRTLRAVLPTYVTDKVVLSKAAPSIRNTYEIRLALLMAPEISVSFSRCDLVLWLRHPFGTY